MKKSIPIMITFILSITLVPTTAFANSAPVYWGHDASSEAMSNAETMTLDKNSSIEVLNEDLTFDFTKDEILDNGSFGIKGQVTAEYQMKNPTNEAQLVKMAFPFIEYTSDTLKNISKIDVTARENNISSKLYFAKESIYNEIQHENIYGIESILSTISNTYDFIDKPCTEYIIQVMPHEHYAGIEIEFSMNSEKTQIIPYNVQSYGGGEGIYSVSAGIWSSGSLEEKQIRLLVIGEDIDFTVKGYENVGENNESEKFDYEISEIPRDFKEVLDEIAFQLITETQAESEEAIITDHLKNQISQNLLIALDREKIIPHIDLIPALNYYGIQILYYEVEFQPNEIVPVTVSYPVSTSMDRRETDAPLYGCSYLFEPAKYWAEFGRLTVFVKPNPEAPYVVESSLDFEKGGSGDYVFASKGLPSDTLTFSLYEEEEVDRLTKFELFIERDLPYYMFFIKPISFLILIILVPTLLFIWVRKKKY